MVAQLADISPGAVKVYIALRAYKKNGGGGNCFPSVPKILSRSGLSAETVRRALNELESGGFILRHKSKGKSNHYTFPDSANGRGDKKPVAASPVELFTKPYLERLQKAFPVIEVQEVLSKFLAFCEENGRSPNKRYFESWLKKEIPLFGDEEIA